MALGFADIADDDILKTAELAARMGYSHVSSLRRALDAMGRTLPPAFVRGRYRGAMVKAWFAGLPCRSIEDEPRDQRSPDGRNAPPPRGPSGELIDINQRRDRLRARLSAAGV